MSRRERTLLADFRSLVRISDPAALESGWRVRLLADFRSLVCIQDAVGLEEL